MRITGGFVLLLCSASLTVQASSPPLRGLAPTACEASCVWADGARCLPTADKLKAIAADDKALLQAINMEAQCYKGKSECIKDAANCQWGNVDGNSTQEGCTVSSTKLHAYNANLVDISPQCGAMGDNFRGQQYCTGLTTQQQCDDAATLPPKVTCKWQPPQPNTPCAVGVCAYVSPPGASDQSGDVYRQMTDLILSVRMQHPANAQCAMAQDVVTCQSTAEGTCQWAASPFMPGAFMCVADGVRIADTQTQYSAEVRGFAKCSLLEGDVAGCQKMSDYCEVISGFCAPRSDKLTAYAYPEGCSLRDKTLKLNQASKRCANTNGSREACVQLKDVCEWVETQSEVCEVISYPVYDSNNLQIFGAARVEEKKSTQTVSSCVVKRELAAQIMGGVAPAVHAKVLRAHDSCGAATSEAACSKVCA